MNASNTASSQLNSEGCCMAFTPQSCPTKGGEVVFVTYSDEFPLPEGADFFLVFSGSKQRHVTTAQQINAYTLRAIVPDHDDPEKVSLTVYCLKDEVLGILTSHKFLYILETEQILAELLAERVSDTKFLESLVPLCSISNNVPSNLRDTLDTRITNAFEFLDLSPSWTLLGENGGDINTTNGQETLLHLSARLGFIQLAKFLLHQPGASHALSIPDSDGKLPLDIAKDKGMKLLADAFSRGAGVSEQKTPKDLSKPQVKKSDIGTTTISSYHSDTQNTLERDIDMLKEINNLVQDEMKKRLPNFKHLWPVRRKGNNSVVQEDASSSEEEVRPSRERTPRKHGINNMSTPKGTGPNRQLLEQNLKRLRDINEEIQRLRLVNQQRGTREVGRGKLPRRLSCPTFRGQDILQAHLLGGKDEPLPVNGTIESRGTPEQAPALVISRSKDRHKHEGEDDSSLLKVDDKSDIIRRKSWGDGDVEEQRPGFHRRVSTSLDDLSADGNKKKKKEQTRSRTQVIDLPPHLTKQEESNKLADILDSIKTASDGRQGERENAAGKNDPDGISNRVGIQGKSYSIACLADLKGDDDEASDLRNSGEIGPEVTEPEADADDSDTAIDKIKSAEADKKGIRRLSMLFGTKSSRTSKRDVSKLGHGSKSSGVRSSMRKEKAQSTTNLSVKEPDFKDKGEPKDTKDAGNRSSAMGRRASGIANKNLKPGEGPTLPNPGMLTKMGTQGGKLPVRSHSGRSTSPLPFRKTYGEGKSSPTPSRKSLAVNHDEGDDKSISSMSIDDGSPDEDDEDESVFNMEGWNDSDLEFKEEAEAWSVTVDKKTLKKMTAKDIKRQDVIHELIQTEVHYVRTLKIMHKIFYCGMVQLLNIAKETVDQIFPQLDELLDSHTAFLSCLRQRQDEDIVVEKIGDILEAQLSGQSGDRMKAAYGDFCSHHIEAVELYKKLYRTDKRFADFIKKCGLNKLCRRLSIPECHTLVTQRLTKYPLLIEAIIKTTKESKQDYTALKKSNSLVKAVLTSVDEAIKEYEKQKKLQDIKMKMDLKVTITYKGGKKVKNIDFASNTSRLIYDGMLSWKTARGKLTETVVVILEDMMVFLQEKDQKYTMLSLDQKAPVIRLHNLMVREVATDMKAIFLVSTSKEGPEMYEMVCNTIAEKKTWMKTLKEAIRDAPKDEHHGEIITIGADEKRKVLLRRSSLLIDHANNPKETDDRRKVLVEIQELVSQFECEEAKLDGDKKDKLVKAREDLIQAMQQVQQSLPCEEDDQVSEGSFSERLSSQLTEDESGPKRADTFSGFDNKLKPASIEQSVIRASSMKTERIGKLSTRPVPGTASPTPASPSLRHKRRGSGGSGNTSWFLGKGDKDKTKTDSTGDHASSSPSNTPSPSPAPGQEESTEKERGSKDSPHRHRRPTVKSHMKNKDQHSPKTTEKRDSHKPSPGTADDVIYF